jgi:5'-3' exonuclease
MRREGLRVTIVSRDKDLAQLVGPGDVYWDYSDAAEYRYEEIPERFGVPPERMADYLALRGDSVDNIPGVPGVGAKTAAALMQRFESLDALYDNLPAVAGLPLRGAAQLPGKLTQHREAAYLARSLTRIHCDAPLAACRNDLEWRLPDLGAVSGFCERQGFGALLPRQVQRIAGLRAS